MCIFIEDSIARSRSLISKSSKAIMFLYSKRISIKNYFSIFDRNSTSIFIFTNLFDINRDFRDIFFSSFYIFSFILSFSIIFIIIFSSKLISSCKNVLIELIFLSFRLYMIHIFAFNSFLFIISYYVCFKSLDSIIIALIVIFESLFCVGISSPLFEGFLKLSLIRCQYDFLSSSSHIDNFVHDHSLRQ